jgi:hypothetical protein
MPPVPIPSPFGPSFAGAKGTWETLENAMGWFSKIFGTFYGYSDGLIKHRQRKVDVEDKLSKAEREAFKIMQEQKDGKTNAVEKVLGKRTVDVDELSLKDWVEALWLD